jgi:hypothetical protein
MTMLGAAFATSGGFEGATTSLPSASWAADRFACVSKQLCKGGIVHGYYVTSLNPTTAK